MFKFNNRKCMLFTTSLTMVISIILSQNIFAATLTNSTTENSVSSLNTVTSFAKQYTASDLSLLARLVNAEAGGECYKAKVAVGAVIMNRVKSNRFPNSISAVINQKYQFGCVQNGSIKRAATASDTKAALAAINGSNPIKNALFFNNGITVSGSIKIGNLVFY